MRQVCGIAVKTAQVVSLNKLAHIRNELSWEFNVGIITP